MTEPCLVLVEWEDASAADDGHGWIARKDAVVAEMVTFQQVGWLLEHTAEHVVMTEALSKDLMAPRTRIPVGMVRAMYSFPVKSGKRVAVA